MRYLIFLLLLAGYPSVMSYGQGNPFELTERLATVTDSAAIGTGNPFDIVRGGAAPIIQSKASNSSAPLVIQPTDPEDGQGSILAIHLILVLALAILWLLFRSLLNQALAGTVNDGIMTQLYRRRSGGQLGAFWMCYLFFYLSAGLYLYFFATHHGVSLLRLGVWQSWLLYSLVVSGMVGLKHLVIFVYARIFPVRKEVSRYAFVLMVFSILTGILLVPTNLLISYAPEEYRAFFLYTGLVLLAGIYTLHLLRGLFIAAPYLSMRPLHILLYICAIEIAPLLLIYRYLTDTLA